MIHHHSEGGMGSPPRNALGGLAGGVGSRNGNGFPRYGPERHTQQACPQSEPMIEVTRKSGLMSVIEICTKPLARRTLSRVRGRQVVWDDARARLQVIICVCAWSYVSTEFTV